LEKIRGVINKRIQEKKKNEFTDLAPIDDIENGAEYLKALHWAIKKKKVKNIALAGPYGAGKSSIIDTYLKKHRIIRSKSLRVSMATFVENETDEKGNPKKISLKQDEIELGILKQLFYKVNYKKIPQSRYRKLHKINWKRVWGYLVLIFLILGVTEFIFFPDTFQMIIEKIEEAGGKFGLKAVVSDSIFLVFCAGILAIIARTYRLVLFRFKVNEVKLPTETVVKNSETAAETVFNKNMDEIVYFFEETKYRIVFFEDLDRLEDPSIFIHLRELNTLLNNYDGIKGRIVFVYAIRDDIFTDTDRTKFFEFIIPVIPIINSTNSGEIFLQKLEESEKKGIVHEISQEFILDVSPYVEDMRILQNIYNEFVVYKETIRTDQDLKLSDETMMALIIFKNLYPREFAELQMERGVVKQAFEDKQKYISRQCMQWQNEVNELTQELKEYHAACLRDVKELKTAMLGELVDWEGITYRIQANYMQHYATNKIMEDVFDLSMLNSIDSPIVRYYSWDGYDKSKTVNNFREIFEKYSKRIKNLQFVREKGVSSIKSEIEDLKKNVHELSGWSLKKLIEKFGVHNVLSEKVAENKLLVFMLRRGYIDEKYANYINYFKGTSITKEDMNYILAVKNMEKLPYNYNLTKVGMVIQRLQPYEFEQKSIFNFILLEYLLSEENENEKRMILIDQLSDRTVESWEFIDEFIEQTQYKERLIQLLAMRWPDMWNDIVQDISITYERKIFYLQLLIDNVDTERLFELNDNNKMSDFIEENPDILQQLSSIQDQKVISLIETLGIIFKNVSIENVSEEVLRYVFENQRYELNDTMIRRIVEFEDGTMLSGLDTRNYTTIISLGYEPLIKYIQENLKQYVKEIILAPNNTKEDVEQIMDLLERMLENVPEETEICLELVNHEEFCVDDISECCGKFDSNFDKGVKILWDELLDKGKVSLKWENIKCYWERYKITPELLQYIETNSDQLTFLENQCLNEVFAEELITSTIDDSAFEKLLPQLELEFDIPIEKVERQKVGILIKKKYIPFDVNKYGEIKDAYPDLCPDFILYNQAEYMEVMEKIPMGETLLETLLLSPILDFSNAEVLLDAFGENYMTAKIAENLVDSKVTINKSIFTAAWEYVDEKGKKTLMFKCLSILEAADFENCFSELSQWYSGFCDRSKKHSVELPNNEESQRLAKRLQEVSYITSYKLQEKEVYDSVTETKKKKSTFVCWIKAIKG